MKTMTTQAAKKHLDAVTKRRATLEDAVLSVVKGFSPALFVWGAPGLGKSHLLTTMLDGIAGAGWKHHTAHSTPKALFMSLMSDPHAVHLFEDCEKMLKTDLCASILRAACGAPNERVRKITYETANERHNVSFYGGVIIATNANLSRVNGPLQGVASRFRPIRWEMSLPERIATIMQLAERPYTKMGVEVTKKECKKVATRLVEMVTDARSDLDLDLRLFTEHALPAYAQAKSTPGMKWEDLLLAKLHGVATTVDETQETRTRHLCQLAQKIDLEGGNTKQKVAKWKQLTELGQAMYFRHLKTGKKT
jgi:hypothetical protein